MDFLYLIISLVVIIKGADFLVDGCSHLAKVFKIPTLIIGLTIVAIATGVPEIAISVSSSLKGANDLLVGNILGSNIFNILFILGLIAIIRPFKVKREIIIKNYVFALLSCLVLFIVVSDTFLDNMSINIITRGEGLLLLCFAGIFLYSIVLTALDEKRLTTEKAKFSIKDIMYIILGIVLIFISAEVIVNSCQNIAKMFNLSEELIGLTIVAIGTNLPELITSIVATKKGEIDIAIGNLVGTNIFNIFLILGIASIINPVTISIHSLIDCVILIITSLLVYIFIHNKKDINKIEGIIMVVMYILYIVYAVIR